MPTHKDNQPDISSDSETESSDEDEKEKPNLSDNTKAIAREWLKKVRGDNAGDDGKPAGKGGERQDISSDDSSESERDEPHMAPSGQTLAVAMQWLEKVRGGPQQPQRKPRSDLSDDSSSDGDDRPDNMKPVGPKAAKIARMWLQSVQGQGPSVAGPNRHRDVSSDETTSDSNSDGESERRARGGDNVPSNLSQQSQRMLRLWLGGARG